MATKTKSAFVQFHPSYDYTDFVEGLRPVSNGDGAIEFKLEDGILRSSVRERKKLRKLGGQEILMKLGIFILSMLIVEMKRIFDRIFLSHSK